MSNAREALEEFEGDARAQARFQRMLAEEAAFQGLPRGDWPEDADASQDFTLPFDILTKEPLPRVHVALVPTEKCWEVPAFLMFGGWNACPYPHHHVAIMKYWHEQRGAEVVGITHDIVEMRAARPPRSRARALDLAREQYLYCTDIVDQGTRTLDRLAATLLGGTAWYFWWD